MLKSGSGLLKFPFKPMTTSTGTFLFNEEEALSNKAPGLALVSYMASIFKMGPHWVSFPYYSSSFFDIKFFVD